MANYTAADIKALRERTGAGMLDVKKALDEADGDAEKALEIIRVKGLKGISKREGRAASDGLVAANVAEGLGGQTGVLIELNCETDFVTKNAKFISLAGDVLATAAAMVLAYWLRFEWQILPVTKGLPPWWPYLQLIPVTAVLWPTVFYFQGLYQKRRARSRFWYRPWK